MSDKPEPSEQTAKEKYPGLYRAWCEAGEDEPTPTEPSETKDEAVKSMLAKWPVCDYGLGDDETDPEDEDELIIVRGIAQKEISVLIADAEARIAELEARAEKAERLLADAKKLASDLGASATAEAVRREKAEAERDKVNKEWSRHCAVKDAIDRKRNREVLEILGDDDHGDPEQVYIPPVTLARRIVTAEAERDRLRAAERTEL